MSDKGIFVRNASKVKTTVCVVMPVMGLLGLDVDAGATTGVGREQNGDARQVTDKLLDSSRAGPSEEITDSRADLSGAKAAPRRVLGYGQDERNNTTAVGAMDVENQGRLGHEMPLCEACSITSYLSETNEHSLLSTGLELRPGGDNLSPVAAMVQL